MAKKRKSKLKSADKANPNDSVISVNRRARYDYAIQSSMEVGIILFGSELKPVRAGHVDLRDCFARISDGELWLHGLTISKNDKSSYMNHDPVRPRKLLVHKSQLKELSSLVNEKRLSLVALKLYFKKGIVKIELGIGKGKRKYDKRSTIIDRERERQAQRAIKEYV